MTQPSTMAPGIPPESIADLQRRWLFAQALLLDNPKIAALEAGQLVADTMRLATETFEQQRNQIERAWPEDSDPDTDELRSVMQRHRSLFEYLLAAEELVNEVETLRRERIEAATPPAETAALQVGLESDGGPVAVEHMGRRTGWHAGGQDRHRSWRHSRVAQWLTGSAPRPL